MFRNAFRFLPLILIVFFLGCQSLQPNSPTNTAPPVSATSTAGAVTAVPTAQNTLPISSSPTSHASTPALLPSPVPIHTVPGPTRTASPTQIQPSTPEVDPPIIIDHRSIELFDQIPETYLEAARNLRLVFVDRSVGENINRALDCLAAPSWASASPGCRRDYIDSSWNWKLFDQSDLSAGRVPERIYFQPSPTRYNRDQWTYVFLRPGDWKSAGQEFFEEVIPAHLESKDVFSLQFGYGEVDQLSDIIDPQLGFFTESPDRYEITDLEAFQDQHRDKRLVYWTSALSRGIGTREAVEFNQQLRQFVQDRGRVLFDLADIESHTDQGVLCYDNRDGLRYCDHSGDCENHPDDGQEFVAICQDYTTEANAGHLGSVSAGKIRLAKAMWVLMARLAGWVPE